MNLFHQLRLVLVFLLTSLLVGCNNQPEKVESSFDIYQKYREKGVATVFTVPPNIASIFLDEKQTGNAELKDILGDINNLSFLIIPNQSSVKENVYYTEINQKLNNINFQDLAIINNGDEIINLKVLHGDNDSIVELIILVSNYETLFSVSFKGDINQNKIANLSKPENMEAVSNLNRFKR